MDATGEWIPVPCMLAASHPAGPVREAVLEEIVRTSESMLQAAGPIDAVYICNHGAMVAEHDHDPDGLLWPAFVRQSAPMHSLSQRSIYTPTYPSAWSMLADLIVGYRTNPHVDQIERGEEAAFSIRRILASGKRPKVAHIKLPLVPSSVTLLSAEHPTGR